MKIEKRQLALGGALVATLVATVFAPDPDQAVVAAASAPDPAGEAARVDSARTPEEILGIRPRDSGDSPRLAFQARQWSVPPPSKAPVAKAAKAQPAEAKAPPLPFKVLGSYGDGGEPAVFLQFNDKTLVVKAGDVVNDKYRVESIAEGKVTFLYAPLAEKQTLAVGDAN